MKLQLFFCFLAVSLWNRHGRAEDCGLYQGDFKKSSVLKRLDYCMKNRFESPCRPLTQPEILLEKAFKRLWNLTSTDIGSAEGCSKIIKQQLPQAYDQILRKYDKLNEKAFWNECLDVTDICRDNMKFVYSGTCFLMTHCSKKLASIAYVMLYSYQQISVQTEMPLRCDGTSKFDPLPEIYFMDSNVDMNILDNRFCEGLPIPPLREQRLFRQFKKKE
ncbi:unnamed protein product [Bursaphelenchus xylophilus]|uniref:(pine wood nematode) hypothetical protein n=1 Tax=Bursaphelenchus xylophilus TaxID=6326 RepID=A0A1I7RYP0_BURXY|nr:unnamed protein product [Bursaphelenchus xylophilus]CAG9092455.1 unnamed protein product [Bursaphelenchus xylophilus]